MQMVLTVGVAAVLAVLAVLYPSFKLIATFVSVSVGWLDVLFIDRIQSHYRKKAARVQEVFDCELFGLEWNCHRVGEEIEPECVHGAARDYVRSHRGQKLREWYPPRVAELPLPLARLLCQRACFWWDATQRGVYGFAALFLVVAAVLLIAIWGLCRDLKLADLLLSVYAPLSPAVLWGLREFWRQKDAADTQEKSRAYVEKTCAIALAGDLPAGDLALVTRQIQDALFDARSKNPMIFNWVYGLLRTKKEEDMNKAANSLVDKALAMRNRWEAVLR